jgi:SAM-dependent methyltransferase
MKAEHSWKPTKFERRGAKLTIGPETSAGSWLLTRLLAEAYGAHLPRHARGRLVDLGCGTVPLYCGYKDLVDEVVCVDWGGSKVPLPHLDVEHDLNQPLPFVDQSFDTVILSDVLEHVARPAELLGEIGRILAPSGKLLANVPFLYWLHAQPYDYFRYTEHGLRSLLQRAGLSALVLEPLGGGLGVIADITAKHLSRLPLLGAPLSIALQRSLFSATQAPFARAALDASRQRFPLAYFLVAEKSRS